MSSILKLFLKAPPLPPTAKEMGREVKPTEDAMQVPPRPRIRQAEGPRTVESAIEAAVAKLAIKDSDVMALAKSFGVKEEDLRKVYGPEFEAPDKMSPQTRHHIEHLERQLAMEQMRTKELRAQLMDQAAELAVLQEAGNSDLAEDYEGLSAEDVMPWVERVLLPAYGLAVAKLRGVALGALLILSALPIQAGDEWGRERTRDRSRESTDWSDSRESRESSDWSSDWGGGGTIPPSVPEPGSAAGLLVVAGAALVLRRQVGRRGR